VNGGLTDFSPPEGYFLLDHDQRNTLHVGGNVNLRKTQRLLSAVPGLRHVPLDRHFANIA
jgi:hypothetical protein